MRMKLSDFNYELPQELLSEYPSVNRDESRLMVVNREDQSTIRFNRRIFKNISRS